MRPSPITIRPRPQINVGVYSPRDKRTVAKLFAGFLIGVAFASVSMFSVAYLSAKSARAAESEDMSEWCVTVMRTCEQDLKADFF